MELFFFLFLLTKVFLTGIFFIYQSSIKLMIICLRNKFIYGLCHTILVVWNYSYPELYASKSIKCWQMASRVWGHKFENKLMYETK